MPLRFAPHERICRDPMTAIMVASTAISAVGQIQSGIAQKRALEEQADQQREQARIAALEAEQEAVRREEERDRMLATQRVAFAANGIRVTPGAGSVLAVMADTTEQFNKEIAAVRRRGAAEVSFGFREANISENKARAALLAGFTGAAGSIASTAGALYQPSAKVTTTKTTSTKAASTTPKYTYDRPAGPLRKDGTF